LIILAVAILATVISLVIPPVISQSKQLIESIPDLITKYQIIREHLPNLQESLNTLSKNIGSITGGFVSVTAGIFGGIVAFFAAIVMTVYMLLSKDSISLVIKSVVAPDQHESVLALARKISRKVGDWFRGQMLLGLIIGVLDYIGLMIIGAPYALTLALLSGVLEIIPTIGPLISGTIAVLVTLGSSPIKALFVALLYIIVQQLENSLIVPKVMQKAVGLSPVVIILAILTGAKLMGVVGAVIAVPIAASISVIIREWPTVRETFNKND
jgi:predicted PurR-regulated permease PerM